MLAQRPRQRQEPQAVCKSTCSGVHPLQQRGVLRLLVVLGRAPLHVRAEPADLHKHRLVRVGADAQRLLALAGLVEHLQGRLERDFIGREPLGQARPPVALLQERPVTADADENLRLPRSPSPPAGLPSEMRHTSRASIS